MLKKAVQQGRRRLGAQNVLIVREHDKGPRSPLVDFFSILLKASTHGSDFFKIDREQIPNIMKSERHHGHSIQT